MDSFLESLGIEKPCSEMSDDELREHFVKKLEKAGWKREIAGEDWEPAVNAAIRAERTRCGILVTGAFGCGKTSFIRAITNVHVVHLCNREELDWLDPDGSECGLRYYALLKYGVVLDDLGAEHPRNDYGVKYDMAGDYIVAHHLEGSIRFYITTNLTADQIYERYGGRVADRLKEMCVPLVFKGKSKRQWMR